MQAPRKKAHLVDSAILHIFPKALPVWSLLSILIVAVLIGYCGHFAEPLAHALLK